MYTLKWFIDKYNKIEGTKRYNNRCNDLSKNTSLRKHKYNDKKYLLRVLEMISELKERDYETRSDGVLPYSKEVIIQHIKNRIGDLK